MGAGDRVRSVSELWNHYIRGQIAVEPDFQRHYVWDVVRASRYIESLLLRMPTPPAFVSEDLDNQWVVIDGHQRLETLFRFMKPLLGGPTLAAGGDRAHVAQLAPLTLTKLEILPELDGKGVTALNRDDRIKLWDTPISVITLPSDAHPDMRYALFARLNLGSMSLNAQELRNCLYRGPYNKLIASLGESQEFLRLWGKTDERFTETLWAGTTRPEAVQTRIRLWTQALNGILQEGGDAVELGAEVHERLRESNICGVCPHPMSPDDAVWHALPSGKRLVHRHCKAELR